MEDNSSSSTLSKVCTCGCASNHFTSRWLWCYWGPLSKFSPFTRHFKLTYTPLHLVYFIFYCFFLLFWNDALKLKSKKNPTFFTLFYFFNPFISCVSLWVLWGQIYENFTAAAFILLQNSAFTGAKRLKLLLHITSPRLFFIMIVAFNLAIISYFYTN